MEQIVRVRQTYDDGTAQVIHLRQSACSGDCHKCSGCGAVQETLLLRAENPIGARPGQMVKLTSDTGATLGAAAMLYVLPLVLFFLGYLAGELLWQQGAPVGCLGFVLGIAGAVMLYRSNSGKEKIKYTITGFAQSELSESRGKGDN